MSFKDNMILEAEKAINSKRIRREQLEVELEILNQEEAEARAVLQLLRTGKVSDDNHKKQQYSHQDYIEAIDLITSEKEVFTHLDVAGVLGNNEGAASQKIAMLIKDGYLNVVKPRGAGQPHRTLKKA